MTTYKNQLFINGRFVAPILGGTYTTLNPATNLPICEVANGTKEDVDVAVQAARECLESAQWGYKSTGKQRAEVLNKLGELIGGRQQELAALDSLEQGKPMREALADMGDAVAACAHFAKLAEERDGTSEVVDNGTDGAFITTIVLEPIGVIGAITPWNYPMLMGIWKAIPAMAAGCTMVLKPSELASLSCLLLAELFIEAGLPAGAFNVITGLGPDCGAAISNHPDIDKISFTGSTATGRKVMMAAALGPRAVSLELGGKSPLIVFEDAAVDAAVDWIITGILWGSGQVCSATSRVLLHADISEAVIKKLLERVAAVKIGASQSEEMLAYEGPCMGPVVSRAQYDKIWNYINEAASAGVKVLYGGDVSAVASLGEGYFVPPTIFYDVPTDSRIWKEEIFGPVLCIRTFTTEEEALAISNDSEYGLAAAVFSADLERCQRVAKAFRAGIVWTNCCQPAFIQAPWGGVKRSGFGRELGRWGLEEFTSVKQVTSCASGHQWSLW